MMNNKLLFRFNIMLNLNLLYKKELNILLLKEKYGVLILYLPSFFFFKIKKDNFMFNFINKIMFIKFLKQFLFLCNYFFKIFFFRIKLKGLGYRIKKITSKIYRFFLAYNHYFYFFIPKNIFVLTKKRNLLALSIDKIKLNNIFYNLIILKKLDFYERTNSFITPNKILFIKK